MSVYDDYGIGDAQQFFGTVAPWAQDASEEIYSNEGRNYPLPSASEEGYYSNEGRNYPTTESTQGPGGSPINASMATNWDRILNNLKGFAGKAGNFASSPQGIMALLAALAAYSDRQKAGGGGTKLAYQGPRQYTRTVAPGAMGTPIARYAANGGMMQAYAGGGHVQMEDGGFVMTKRAVDGAGGPQGIRQLVPGARPIRGPGTGTSDSIPATIQGPNGATPAKVSNGEAYVPRAAVQQAGGPQRMYALMNSLQRKA